MVFSLVLALLNGYVQLKEGRVPTDTTEKIAALEGKLPIAEDKLVQIRSAAEPILMARGNSLMELPPGLERDTLIVPMNLPRDTLQ
jgi:hypothetical protein